jgi:outer membrane murein-binding lipoprotein Lpp|nr:MAG TPA: holin family protein [Caudoviricetes sp.]
MITNSGLMLDALWSWIMTNYPGIFVVLACVVIAWILRGRFERVNNRIKKCENHATDIAEVKNAVGGLRTDINSMRMDIKSIKDYLVNKDQRAANILSMKNSPRVLNPNGKMIYDIIGGDKFIADNRQLLIDKIKNKNPATPLDVELYAKEVCIELLSDPIFDNIKNIVYNAPAIKLKKQDGTEEDYGFTIADVCFVLSLPLRDEYLKEYPDLKSN